MEDQSFIKNADVPVIPLPNPGEGGPLPDFNFPNIPDVSPEPDMDAFPVIPLPNPGEGGPLPTFPNNNNNSSNNNNNNFRNHYYYLPKTDYSLLFLQYYPIWNSEISQCCSRI